MKPFEPSRSRSRAFTLIELLVVIAIIGLLSSVALVSTGPTRAKARDARRQADIRQIATAMELCYDDEACSGGRKYPLVSSTTGPARITGYLDPLPADPVNEGDSTYKWATNVGFQGKYCVYMRYETPRQNPYFAASEKGVRELGSTQSMPAALDGATSCW